MSRRSGIVNVRMVITEEKILSNIDKVQKLINPKSKKQIVQLDDDVYFKDLIESIKAYLIEYPKKKNFPASVYKAAYGLVEYATTQFEENTKKVEKLIKQREDNVILAGTLKELVEAVETKDPDWKKKVEENKNLFSEDVIETLKLVGKDKSRKSQNYKDAIKLLNARVSNLETNLHIEIDLERTEDRSKALSYIGIEVADALKDIPRPANLVIEENDDDELIEEISNVKIVEDKKAKEEKIEEQHIDEEPNTEKVKRLRKIKGPKIKTKEENKEVVSEKTISQVVAMIETDNTEKQVEKEEQELQDYQESVIVEKKPSLWQKIKNSKIGRAISYVLKIRIRIELPNALPEGRGDE